MIDRFDLTQRDDETEAEWHKRLASMLPDNLIADWCGTNHYEVNGAVEGEYCHAWWDADDFIYNTDSMLGRDLSGTRIGQRLGLLLEAACAFKAIMERDDDQE